MNAKSALASMLILFSAWVLWAKEYGEGRRELWTVKNAYETAKECKEAALGFVDITTRYWQAAGDTVTPYPHEPEGLHIVQPAGTSFFISFKCIPDTLDPRPK